MAIRSHSDLGLGDLDAAAITHLALVTDALVLTAVALPVLGRSKNALAVQAVTLRLQGAVVDGFGLFDLAVAPSADLLREARPILMESKTLFSMKRTLS